MPIGNAAGEFLAGAIVSPAIGNAAAGPMSSFSIIGNYVAPMQMVGFAETSRLLVTGAIDAEVWDNTRRMLGFIGDPLQASDFHLTNIAASGGAGLNWRNLNRPMTVNDRHILFNKHLPSPDELNIMYNRGLVDTQLYHFAMKQVLDGEPGLTRAFEQLRFEIPGPSDWIMFAVRDCFNPQIVSTFQHNTELPIAILPYMQMLGLHMPLNIAMPPGATTTEGPDTRQSPQIFDLHWWSHWQLPGIGQVYMMLQQLYADSPYGASPRVQIGGAVNMDDVRLFLKTNDYSPYWRNKLIAISYPPLTRVDTRRMYDLDVIKEADVYHSYRLQGYDDGNATFLTQFTVKQRIEARVKPIRQKFQKELHDLFLLGGIEDDEIVGHLVSLNMPENVANSLVNTWKIEYKNKRLKMMLKTVQSGYFLGTLSDAQLGQSLTNLGVIPEIRLEYKKDWEFIKYTKRKFASAQQNRQFYVAGLISRNQYVFRLTNLNYDQNEIIGIVLLADLELAHKAAEAAAKAFAEQEKQFQKKLAKLLEPYNDTNIKKMFAAGAITTTQIFIILKLRGWSTSAVNDWMGTYIKEILDEKTQKQLEKKPTILLEQAIS